MTVLIPGDHEVVTTEPPDLRSLKFTHTKQRGTKYLDNVYPSQLKITIILDNLKVHTSKETTNYLASIPNRFHFVFTPKHASWGSAPAVS